MGLATPGEDAGIHGDRDYGSDPAIFLTIAIILIATGLIACLVPGSRAARVDPLVALRYD